MKPSNKVVVDESTPSGQMLRLAQKARIIQNPDLKIPLFIPEEMTRADQIRQEFVLSWQQPLNVFIKTTLATVLFFIICFSVADKESPCP